MKERLFQILSYDYFFKEPTSFPYLKWQLIFFGIILAFAFGFKFYQLFNISEKDPRRPFFKVLFWGSFTSSLLGFLFIFFRTQELPTFSIRFFYYLNILILLIFSLSSFVYFKKKMPSKVLKYKETMRKEKWLPKKKR
ncbi:MAG: hypothetical protein M1355_01205 [Patescibacteria group bacterium]|nr:hypothetical protein [Patescibacteria group bacterium]